jgi:hypothetical protein
MSRSIDEQFEMLEQVEFGDLFDPNDVTLPSSMPMPPQGLPSIPLPKLDDPFRMAENEARQAQAENPDALLQALQELPQKIVEALRNG